MLAGRSLPGLSGAEDAERPNVILIVTDDQGYGDLGCHGNPILGTPHLGTLARESFRLTNFHVDPTCAETRSALMTGRYSARVGVWHTIRGRSILRSDETTLGQIFQENGYATGAFGKWHLGDNYPFRPQDRGFDRSVIHGGGGVGQTPDVWGNDYFDDAYFVDGEPQPQQGYCTDVFFRHALDFVRSAGDEPFFCYLATNAPHGPYRVAPEYAAPYLKAGVPQPAANFYGMIANIDDNVGRLREELDRLGLAEKTILIFMTDNGTAAGVAPRAKGGEWQGFDAGMRGQKGSEYDGGHRVPCFVHAPQLGVTSDQESATLTAHLDLAPTLAELCGLELPAETKPFDGTSLAGVLRGREPSPELADRILFVHSQRRETPKKWHKTSVMQDSLRLVDDAELYDVAVDPGQKQNLIEARPGDAARLRAAYDRIWADVSTRFDEPARIVLGSNAAPSQTLTCHDWHTGDDEPQPPWDQSLVAKNPAQNGHWTVRIATPGLYRVRLRLRPPGVTELIPAGQATLKVGRLERTQRIAEPTEEVVFDVPLEQGDAELSSTLEGAGSGTSRGAYFVLVELLGPTASAEPDPASLKRYRASRPAMGVVFKIDAYAESLAVAEPSFEAAFARVREIDRIASDYDPNSELRRLTLNRGGEPVEVSPTLFDLLQRSIGISQSSGGRFDPTLGPLTTLWRKARKSKTLPSEAELSDALARTGVRHLTLDEEARTITLGVENMLLDLGGIAKGYAADEALRILREKGLNRAVVAASGDLAIGDPPPDAEGWRVGIATLEVEEQPKEYLLLSNCGVSTSGDARQFVEIDGRRYSHIVDPETGLGLSVRSGVTVVAPDDTTADAWASALSVAGPDQAAKALEGVEDISARMVYARRQDEEAIAEVVTPGFPEVRRFETKDRSTSLP
ncbi:MAG TPA: FAD:protein FMN transferase [Pirellulaceae bacterium]|nr:FAD:protein FMN transferase [Pirellulaceae bacterium]